MKNNLISGIASWKSAALLAIVAMVAAVAFSGVLSTGQTAEAQAVDFVATDTYEPGATINLTALAADVGSWAVNDVSSSSGAFSNGETSIRCSDGGTCDVGKESDGTDTPDSIQVTFTIDEDAADGFIVIVPTIVLTTGGDFSNAAQTALVVNVETKPKPASLTLKAASTAVNASGGNTAISVTVMDDQSPANEMAGQNVTLITTSGLFDCDDNGSGETQVCQVTTPDDTDTSADGVQSTVSRNLYGVTREGTAVITATHTSADVSDKTVSVTFFGAAANLDAEVLQGSIEVGGKTFVVLTVTDKAGSAVSDAEPAAATAKAIVPPEVDGPIGVETSYIVDKLNADGTVDIPSCADDDNDDATGVHGTNDDGQCVVQITAPKKADAIPEDTSTTPATPAVPEVPASASRGVHTLNFALGELAVAAEVTVAGPASSVTSDAPDNVEELSTTTITVTVTDDEEVLAGETSGTVVKVAGQGIVDDGSSAIANLTTSNGTASFDYTAGLAPDTAVFRVSFGDAKLTITVTVGEPAPDEAVTWNKPLASGTHNLVWNGADGADPADAGDVVAIWQWTGSGWVGYFSAAGDVGLANTLTELNNGEAYWVVVE